jgi:hypothetical protein
MYWKAKPQQVDVTSRIGQNTSKPMQSQMKKMTQQESMAHEYVHAAQILLDDYYENRVGVPYEDLDIRYFKRLREYIKYIKSFMSKNMIHESDIQDAIDVIRDVESEIVLAGGSVTGSTANRAAYTDPVVFMDRVSRVSGVAITKPKKSSRRKK